MITLSYRYSSVLLRSLFLGRSPSITTILVDEIFFLDICGGPILRPYGLACISADDSKSFRDRLNCQQEIDVYKSLCRDLTNPSNLNSILALCPTLQHLVLASAQTPGLRGASQKTKWKILFLISIYYKQEKQNYI